MEKVPKNETHSYPVIIGWIVSWFALNMAITIFNKGIFEFGKFYFPSLLTAVHMICSWIGGGLCISVFKLCEVKKLERRGELTLFAMSLLFTANIIFGNVSLRYVSVAFNQIFRATVPAVTMVLSKPLLGETFSNSRIASMAVVILGVMVSCYGDIEFTTFGFLITFAAVVAAAVKAVVSSMVLTGEYKLHPIDLLYRMSLHSSWQSLLWAGLVGELQEFGETYESFTFGVFAIVIITGLVAFFLNIASFYVNKVTSALSLTIVANAKQVVVIVLGIIVFSTPVNATNVLGVIIVTAGSIWYSFVGYQETEAKRAGNAAASSPKRMDLPVMISRSGDEEIEAEIHESDDDMELDVLGQKDTIPLIPPSQQTNQSLV